MQHDFVLIKAVVCSEGIDATLTTRGVARSVGQTVADGGFMCREMCAMVRPPRGGRAFVPAQARFGEGFSAAHRFDGLITCSRSGSCRAAAGPPSLVIDPARLPAS